LRKENSAKLIQNAWRKSEKNSFNSQYVGLLERNRSSSSTIRKPALRNAKFLPFRTSKLSKSTKEKEAEKENNENNKSSYLSSLDSINLQKQMKESFQKRRQASSSHQYEPPMKGTNHDFKFSLTSLSLSFSVGFVFSRISSLLPHCSL
jgi:hypothetical protein